MSISINWSSMNIHRPSELIYEDSFGAPKKRYKKKSKCKSVKENFEHHSWELFSYQISIVLIHFLISSSILLIIMSSIVLMLLIILSFLLKFFLGLSCSSCIIIFSLKLLIRKNAICFIYKFNFFSCGWINIRMIFFCKFVILYLNLRLICLVV